LQIGVYEKNLGPTTASNLVLIVHFNEKIMEHLILSTVSRTLVVSIAFWVVTPIPRKEHHDYPQNLPLICPKSIKKQFFGGICGFSNR